MKLDFLIAASPTPAFFSQIAFFRKSLSVLGGDYSNARVVAVFGDHKAEVIPLEWQHAFDKIEIEWAHPIGADNSYYRAQHDRRFEIIRPDADLAIMCDADIAILKPFDELIAQLIQNSAMGGVIAHYHFPWGYRRRRPDVHWPKLAKAVLGRKDIPRPYRYTLAPSGTSASSPFYVNYGFVAAPPAVMTEFYKRDLVLRELTAKVIGHYWAPQISLALTCEDLKLPTMALPMRYNFPNDPVAEALYPEELEEIVVLHYMRTKHFKRDKIFADPASFDKFVTGKFEGSNEVFRRHVETVCGGAFPFSAIL